MRLNDGLPVWHASVSLQHQRNGPVYAPVVTEAHAVTQLAGVGRTDGEWWLYSPGWVGHLRVGITPDEATTIWPDGPPPLATTDAGESGPYRVRTMKDES